MDERSALNQPSSTSSSGGRMKEVGKQPWRTVKVKDIVDRSVGHAWSIPEFQRGFVWKSTQVRDLAESLWLDYPIGSLLVWNSRGNAEERVATDTQRPTLWVVDGQQRATALSILFGRKL
jgi:uncharacterized protein with ParB-like and HNH nuclease domain